MRVLDLFVPAILAQVTLITVATLVVIWFARRHAAFRHAAGFVGLLFVVSSPWLVLTLPRPAWLLAGQPPQGTTPVDKDQAANRPLPGVQPNREIADEPDLARDRAPWRQPVAMAPQQPKPVNLPEAAESPATSASTAMATTVAPKEPQDVAPARATDGVVVRPRAWGLSTVVLILTTVWCLGTLVIAFRDWQRRRELRIITRTASDTDHDRLTRTTQDVCLTLGLNKLPRIRVSDLSPLPFVLGVWRPIVVLPRGLLTSASDARLRDILIHECAHIVRKDAWVHLLQRISAILFWFHPGVLWLNAQIARAREELCDNFVLLAGDAAEFAETLLELSESYSGKRLGLSTIGLFSTRWTLEQRVAGLLDPDRDRKTRTRRGTLALLTVLFAPLSLLAGGIGMVAEKAGAENAPPVAIPGEAEARAEGTADAPRPSGRKVTIHGKCVDDDGNPVAGAIVRVLEDRLPSGPLPTTDRAPVAVVAEVKSDKSGEFVFKDVTTPLTTPHPQHQRQLYIAATAEGRASAVALESWELNSVHLGATELSIGSAEDPFLLSANRQTVSGVVTDAAGRPVAGARVFMGTAFGNPFPGMWSAVTDHSGRYAIDDLERWKKTVTEEVDLDGSTTTITATNSAAAFNSRLRVYHPQYAIAAEAVGEVPKTVDIQLKPAAIVEGRVSDRVTGKPAVDVVVFAKGIGRDEFAMAKTDARGRYRLQLSRDHYNIWVEAEDRIATVRKAVFAVPGKPVTNADFELLEGGFVVGTVIDEATNRPLAGSADKPYIVAHYGPACVRIERLSWPVGEPDLSIGVQQETRVSSDGTFRLRAAPGRNAVFFIENYGETEQSPQIVTLANGEEKQVELRVRLSAPDDLTEAEGGLISEPVKPWEDAELDADRDAFLQIRRDVAIEDQQAQANAGKTPRGPSLTKVPSRERPDSIVNRLLDKFERQSIGKDNYRDPWLRTIKEIVDLGSAAVPELIEELDATQDPWMLQLLGFTLRAVDDRRSIPALIRAIPKTMLATETEKKSFTIEEWQMYRRPPERIMLSAMDPVLRTFAQANQLEQYIQENEEEDRKSWYRFDSPAREICGALTKLTGAHNGEDELLEVESYSVRLPDEIRARQQLFQRVANDWSAWWQQHQNDRVVSYSVSPTELQAIQAAVRRGAHVTRDGTQPGSPVTRVGFHRDEAVTLDDLNLLKAFPKLRELWMPLNVDPPQGGMKIIGELDSLTDLHLGTTNSVGRSIVGPGLKELRRLPQLQVLTLGNIANKDLTEIGQFTHLTKLRILGSSIDDAGMKELRGLKHLQEFEVGGYRITDAGLTDLAELTSLKQLDLSHSKITDAGLPALKRLANLESLDLSNTKIKGVGFGDWKSLKHLRRLTLNNTRIGDAAAKEIAEITSLTGLYLTNTKITDEALPHFGQLKDLRYLEVKETEVTPAAMSQLKSVLPHLEISE
ncbi:MAG TPA: M56 family metallopeptidase [Pirellulales bacterium]|nr:M56 family metallopeptidase [Pirellulales bacterium]